MKLRSFLMVALLAVACGMQAVPAKRDSLKIQQPDGSYVTIRLHGDEWHHFQTTDDGYSVVRDNRGYFVYARLQDGQLTPTELVAHDAGERTVQEVSFLAGMEKLTSPQMPEATKRVKLAVQARQQAALAAPNKTVKYENFRGLVILAEFNDKKFSREDYKEIINDMINKEGYSGYDNQGYTGSVRDYFSDNSNGKFKPQFDIVGPYDIDYSQYDAQGTDNANALVTSAVNAANADVNYKDYDRDNDGFVDLVYVIFAGSGSHMNGNDARLFWPHRSCIWNPNYSSSYNYYITRDGVKIFDYAASVELTGYDILPSSLMLDGIGTICHEFSHVLGLPDFYDTDYEKSGGESDHPGEWSVMAGGSYLNNGRTPCGYSLYERYAVEFMEEPQKIEAEGGYSLNPLPTTFEGYRIDTQENKVFFLLENRQKSAFKWDKYLAGSGMLVHRVDKTNNTVWDITSNTVNANPAHNYYEVVRAGGPNSTGREGYANSYDTYPGTKRVTALNNQTSPANLRTWSGKLAKWGLANIKTQNGIVTFDVTGESSTEPSQGKKTVLSANDLVIANGETADLVVSIDYPTTEQITVWDFVLYLPEGIEFATSRLSKSCDVSDETHNPDIANDCLTVKKTADGGYLFVWVDQEESTPLTSTTGKLVTISLKATADVKGEGQIKNINLSNRAGEALDLNNIADVTFAVTNGEVNTEKIVLSANDLVIANGETADLVVSIDYPTTEQITVWDFVLYLPEGIEFATSRLSKSCDVSDETHNPDIANDCLTVKKTADGGYLFVWVDQEESTPLTSTTGKLVTISLKATADVKGEGQIKNIHLSNKAGEALDLNNIADVTFSIISDNQDPVTDNLMYVAPSTCLAGSTATLSICMKNTAAICGFQFDLYLPEGITAVKSNNGKIKATLSDGRREADDEHTLACSEQEDGSIRFLSGSLYEETFTGNDGEVLTLQVAVSEEMEDGDYPLLLKNIKLTESDISKYYEVGQVTSMLTVISYTLGDINGDGKVDVSDYIGIANRILNIPQEGFNEAAADVNEDGVIDVSDYVGVANIILTGSIYGSNNAMTKVSAKKSRGATWTH